jgi:hypothetical protein
LPASKLRSPPTHTGSVATNATSRSVAKLASSTREEVEALVAVAAAGLIAQQAKAAETSPRKHPVAEQEASPVAVVVVVPSLLAVVAAALPKLLEQTHEHTYVRYPSSFPSIYHRRHLQRIE